MDGREAEPPGAGGGEAGPHPMDSRAAWAIAVGAGLLSLVLGAGFLPHQSLWVDETTQLSGLSLRPVETIRWLAGHDRERFACPPDRMPPLSYLAGWLWSRLFGLREASLRWLGVLFTAAATVVVARTAFRLGGLWPAALAGLGFALSPNVIDISVEIRAYPLFLLTSAATFAAAAGIAAAPTTYSGRRVAALSVATLASIYTHFFGVVLAMALWPACAWTVRRAGGRLRPLGIGGAVCFVAALGILPFVISSTQIVGTSAEGPLWFRFAKLFYRLIGHPALGTSRVAVGAAGLGALGLAAAALAAGRRSPPVQMAVLALTLGLGAAIGGELVLRGFSATSISYNLWAFPILFFLLASALKEPPPRWRPFILAAAAVLVLAEGYAALRIETHGEVFSHGPHQRLAVRVREAGGPGAVAVVHVPDMHACYFPLWYDFGPELKQYVTQGLEPLRFARIVPGGYDAPIGLEDLHVGRILIVQERGESAEDLRRALQGQPAPIQESRLAAELVADGRWRLVRSERVVAMSGARVEWVER